MTAMTSWEPGLPVEVMLLDLDGTLCDSAEAITSAMEIALTEHGLSVPSPSVLRSFVGPPFAVALAGIGVEAARVPDIVASYRQHYATRFMLTSPAFEGVVDALSMLNARGVRLAVATSKPQGTARQIVNHLGIEQLLTRGVDSVFGADVTHPGDSKADVIARALQALELVPSPHVVMVGDRVHDVEGAHAHGLATIGVQWGYAAPGELVTAGARCVIDSPSQLVALADGDV